MGEFNWLGILGGVVAGQVIGGLWYGLIFKKAWIALSGITPEPGKSAGPAMALGAVVTLVTVVGLSFVIGHTGSKGWMLGAHAGLFVGVFFAATTVALRAVYSTDTFTRRPWLLFLIDAGYLVVYLPVAGAILGALA